MTREELIAALNSIEWSDVEFKETTWDVPRSALSTVSASANTEGGHLVFGIREANGEFTVTGVVDADRLRNTFLGQVRDPTKISALLPITGQAHQMPEGFVPAFFVPEAARNQKPVHLDRNPRDSYIRRGGRDDTCTANELMRLMRDASLTRFDAEPSRWHSTSAAALTASRSVGTETCLAAATPAATIAMTSRRSCASVASSWSKTAG